MREIDVSFVPGGENWGEDWGVLGRLVSAPCIFATFDEPIGPSEVRDSLAELFRLQAESKQGGESGGSPKLWILSPSISGDLVRGFDGTVDGEYGVPGIYSLPPAFQTGMIALEQLPCCRETLSL